MDGIIGKTEGGDVRVYMFSADFEPTRTIGPNGRWVTCDGIVEDYERVYTPSHPLKNPMETASDAQYATLVRTIKRLNYSADLVCCCNTWRSLTASMHEDPPNLNISVGGGIETNWDPFSSSE